MPPADMNAPEYPETFPELLKWHRVRAGLTQMALSERAKLGTNCVYRLERGQRRPSGEMVLKLARTLSLNLQQTDELIETAGHAPIALTSWLRPMSDADPTYRALRTVLDAPRLSPASKANLRACIEVMCATWLATVPGRVAERREA